MIGAALSAVRRLRDHKLSPPIPVCIRDRAIGLLALVEFVIV